MNTKRASIFSRAVSAVWRVLAPCALLAGGGVLTGCDSLSVLGDGVEANPLVYEIVGQDGQVEGWMLGTIHALPSGVDWRTSAIDRVVDEADLLIVEIADLEDRSAIQQVYADLSISPNLPAIDQRVPPSERETLFELIEDAGLSPSNLTPVETWAVALMLANSLSDGGAENGVDRAVIRDFAGREVIEFEGAVRQLTIFDRLAEEDQREMLSSVIEEAEDAEEAGKALRHAWLTGDVDELANATRTGLMTDPELRAALLVDRNKAWDRRLAPLLRGEPKPLVAVGAAHLVGDGSLTELLEARGYTIRRLP